MDSQQFKQYIHKLFQQQQWTELQTHTQQYLQSHGDDVQVQFYLAIAQKNLGNLTQTQQILQRILHLQPNYTPAKNMLLQLQNTHKFAPSTSPQGHLRNMISKNVVDNAVFADRYRILHELGRGGMGAVYKVHDSQLNREVALKVILAQNSSKSVERFLREAKATAKLDHDNIIRVYDVGTYQKTPYFTMEFIDGKSLKDWARSEQMQIPQITQLMIQVTEGIAHAHRQGIIHRDLKPANIMVTKELQAKVMDFGLAKVSDAEDDLSKTGDIFGTPSYMSPEQSHGGKVDEQSDVYSLGATLYAIFSGRPPFQGVTTINILQQIWEKDPIPLRELNPETPVEIEAITLKCLEKKKEKRYKNAKALAKDLRNFLEHRPIVAKPPTQWTRLQKLFLRHRSLFMTIGIILLVILIGTTFSFIQWHKAMKERITAIKALTVAKQSQAETEKARKTAENLRIQAELEKDIKAKEARRNAIRLTQIVFRKAEEAYERREWRESGVFAGVGLEVIKALHGEDITALQRKGKGLVRAVMFKYPQLWKINARPGYFIADVAWSLDFTNIAIVTTNLRNSFIEIWNVDRGEKIREWTQPGAASQVEWSPDGKILLTPFRQSIHIWNAQTKKLIRTIRKLETQIRWWDYESIYLSDNPMVIMNLRTGKESRYLQNVPAVKVAVSHQKILAAVYDNQKDIEIWHITKNKKMRRLTNDVHRTVKSSIANKTFTTAIKSIHWSPDGKLLVNIFYDNAFVVWDVKANKKIVKYNGKVDQIFWSPDSKKICILAEDKTARIWDLESNRQEAMFSSPNTNKFITASWSPDQRLIATTAFDKVIRLWDVKQQRQIYALTGHKNMPYGKWSRDSKAFVSKSSEKAIVWDLSTPTVMKKRTFKDKKLYRTQWNHDGKLLGFTASNEIHVTDENIKQKYLLEGHRNVVVNLAWHPKQNIIASASFDGTVRLWNNRQQLTTLPHRNKVIAIAWKPSGELLASGDRSIYIWDWQKKRKIHTIANGNIIEDLKWSPKGDYLAAMIQKHVHIWRTSDYKQIAQLQHKERGSRSINKDWNIHTVVNVGKVFWSPQRLTSSITAYDLAVWNTQKYYNQQILLHPSLVYMAATHPQNNLMAISVSDQSIHIWDDYGLQRLNIINAGSTNYGLSWHPNGYILASNDSRSLTLWNMKTRKQILGDYIAKKNAPLPSWYKEIIDENIQDNANSLFNLHGKIPGRFIEYGLDKQPQKITEGLFEARVTESFQFEEK